MQIHGAVPIAKCANRLRNFVAFSSFSGMVFSSAGKSKSKYCKFPLKKLDNLPKKLYNRLERWELSFCKQPFPAELHKIHLKSDQEALHERTGNQRAALRYLP